MGFGTAEHELGPGTPHGESCSPSHGCVLVRNQERTPSRTGKAVKAAGLPRSASAGGLTVYTRLNQNIMQQQDENAGVFAQSPKTFENT